MSDGFQVDLYALHQSADGISRVVDAVAVRPLSSVPSDPAVLGHEGLAGAVSEFAQRWQLGIEDLTEDGRQAAARLTDAATTYERSDATGGRAFDGLLGAPSGPDPAGG